MLRKRKTNRDLLTYIPGRFSTITLNIYIPISHLIYQIEVGTDKYIRINSKEGRF